jgi:hypothetical protein
VSHIEVEADVSIGGSGSIFRISAAAQPIGFQL